MKNILFICSRNRWRSLTAETIFKSYPNVYIKSAGTEDTARIKINSKLIKWADLILVMEKKHKEKLCQKFPIEIVKKELFVLDIEDNYKYMDEELIEELKTSVIGKF